MREKKWTPGPWFACRPEDLGVTVAKLDNEWWVKCDQPVEPGVQNARLIAAAPDLVEELEHARETIQALIREGYLGYVPQLTRIDAALAKAYGETNHD